jgi:hypothetical protein
MRPDAQVGVLGRRVGPKPGLYTPDLFCKGASSCKFQTFFSFSRKNLTFPLTSQTPPTLTSKYTQTRTDDIITVIKMSQIAVLVIYKPNYDVNTRTLTLTEPVSMYKRIQNIHQLEWELSAWPTITISETARGRPAGVGVQ